MKPVKIHLTQIQGRSRIGSQPIWLPAAVLVLAIAGCSASGVITDWNSEDVLGKEPINYRYVVTTSLTGIMGAGNPGENKLEISAPRRALWPRGPVWLVCVKSLPSSPKRPPLYYAVAFQREKVWDSRLAVGADGCEAETYSPFDWKNQKPIPVQQ